MKKFKQKLSLFMALVMALSVLCGVPTGTLVANAAEGANNVTVHLYNGDGWQQPGIYYWGGSATVSGNEGGAIEIPGWGGAQGYALSAEGDNWYSVTMVDEFDGFLFVDLVSSTQTGNFSRADLLQNVEELPVDLYCKKVDSEWKWYVDKACTTELATATYDVTVHYYNDNNWDAVAAWVWSGSENYTGGNWPGVVLEENADKENWYDWSITGLKVSQITAIFNNNNKGSQTKNIDLGLSEGGNEFWVVSEVATTEAPQLWTNPSVSNPEPEEPQVPSEDEDTWNGDINISDLVQVSAGDSLSEMELYLNGVFETAVALDAGTHEVEMLVNGAETGLEKTVTLDSPATVYFRYQGGELKDSVSEGIVHTAAFTGNFWGLGFVDDAGEAYSIALWDPADANAELEYYGGGLYGRTFRFNTLESDVEISDGGYKVAFDDGWDYSIGNGGSNVAVTIPAGRSSFTVFVDEINQKIYDDVRTPDFELFQNEGTLMRNVHNVNVSLIGTVRGAGDNDWNAGFTGYEFSQISDTLHRYQMNLSKGTYNYKCVFDYTNWYNAEEGNRVLEITEDNTHVVFIYNTTDGKLYDTVNNADEVSVMFGMKAAPAKMEVATNKNGSITFNAVAEEGSDVTLYYGEKADVLANGAVALTAVEMKHTSGNAYSSDAIFFGDEAMEIAYYYDVNGSKVLDGSNLDANVAEYSVFKKAAFTGRIVNVPGTFPGPSWDAASNQMTYDGNGIYHYTFKNVPAANYEYKISFGSWDENYGVDGTRDGANYAVTVPETKDVTVYYNDFSHRAVNSINYVFVDVSLKGTGIPEGTKLTDNGLTGIYSAKVALSAGTYNDIQIINNTSGVTYTLGEITLEEAKEVTFFLDPVSGIFYSNASDEPIITDAIYYNSKEEEYKSVFGAVATGEELRFSITTGTDITSALLVVKGMEGKTLSMVKDGEAVDGVQKWSVTASFETIGEYTYYFALSNGSAVSIYADDDGYYGEGVVTDLTNIKPYDLVVYKAGYETPDWMKNAVVYHIFPDRFFDGEESNNDNVLSARGEVDYEYITDWYVLPENPEQEDLLTKEEYEATGAFYGDKNWSNEIYGGDLKGIVEKIDYLKAIGVNVIYLNPVFTSISSHRYDTSDYREIDPILGTQGDFEELVRVAEENDMHIVLDGVFNHVSDDSIYFDRYYKYLESGVTSVGAYPYWAYVYDYMAENAVNKETAENVAKEYFAEEYGITDFSYVEWFDVFSDSYLLDADKNPVTDGIGLRAGKPVYGYDGWWGYDSMPIIKSTNGSEYQTGNWAEDIIYNQEGTSVTQYWISEGSNGWRLDVANEVSDETWQNFRASVKALDSDAVIIGEIWDDATEYLMGDMYDSVMNYMFRSAVTAFAKGGDAGDAMNTLEKLRERYPEEAFYAMMNLVASHDTTRILSFLDGIDDDRNQKDAESAFPTYETTSDLAKKRQYLVAFLQFTYAGAPTIYYGDEIGMVGADDPDDRRGFTWGKGNEELVTWYATLAQIRNNNSALRTGTVEPFEVNENILAFVRRDESAAFVILANNGQDAKEVEVDLNTLNISEDVLVDLLSNTSYTVTDGKVTVTVPALSGVILADEAMEIVLDEEALAQAYDEKYVIAVRDEVPPADPTPAPEATEAPTPTPAPEATEAPTPTPAPEATEAPASTPAPEATEAPASTPAPEATPAPTQAPTGGDDNRIVINGNVDWRQVEAIIAGIMSGENAEIEIVLGQHHNLPASLIIAIQGRDITLSIAQSNGVIWEINGLNVQRAIDMSLQVIMDSNVFSQDRLNAFDGYRLRQISLVHDGDFGFEATLRFPMESSDNGKYANLFYDNNGRFQFMGSCQINGGYTEFTFTHASDYVLVISEEALSVKSPVTGDLLAFEEESESSMFFGVVTLIVICTLGTSIFLLRRKKKNS